MSIESHPVQMVGWTVFGDEGMLGPAYTMNRGVFYFSTEGKFTAFIQGKHKLIRDIKA